MEETIMNALRAHAEGNLQLHKANIQVYLSNSTGVGEQSDILDAIQGELHKISVHSEGLELLDYFECSS